MILFGDLAEIKRSRGANSVVVETPSHPAGLPGARRHAGRGGKVELPGRTKSGSDYSSPPRQACSCSG